MSPCGLGAPLLYGYTWLPRATRRHLRCSTLWDLTIWIACDGKHSAQPNMPVCRLCSYTPLLCYYHCTSCHTRAHNKHHWQVQEPHEEGHSCVYVGEGRGGEGCVLVSWWLHLLPPSKKWHFRIVLSQFFSTLTKCIGRSISVYDIKHIYYKNISRDESNDIYFIS
jgi:hypothetical protein